MASNYIRIHLALSDKYRVNEADGLR